MVKRIIKNYGTKGFSLIEVLIALTLFLTFILAFILGQESNKNKSIMLKEDVNLHNLAEYKMNEVLLNPPQFSNATESDVESKNFELEDYKHYKYTIKFKKLTVPNLTQLTGESDDGGGQDTVSDQSIQKMVYEKLKTNIEEILWQVNVTVTNTETDYSYELSSWIINEEAKVDVNLAF